MAFGGVGASGSSGSVIMGHVPSRPSPPDRPRLHGGGGGGAQARGAVLVLHGGRESSAEPVRPTHLAYARMLDFYWSLRWRSSAHTAVYLLRFRVRGWNAERELPDPVADARWALDELRERHPSARLAMLGHSMGGRAAVASSAEPAVTGVCALAPWLPEGEPLPAATAGRAYVLAHGTADRMTSAPASLSFAQRLRAAGAEAARFELADGSHALVDHARLWRRFAVDVALGLAGDRPLPATVAQALGETGTNGLSVPLDAAVDGDRA